MIGFPRHITAQKPNRDSIWPDPPRELTGASDRGGQGGHSRLLADRRKRQIEVVISVVRKRRPRY